MNTLVPNIETTRLELSEQTTASIKSQYGQFFTPSTTAIFMANLFPDYDGKCTLLDAGAGIGSLSAAFLDRWTTSAFHFKSVELDAFEIDRSLHPYLNQTLEKYADNPNFRAKIWDADFIEAATSWISGNMFAERLPQYSHAILNPPYKKIKTRSKHRRALRLAGIETVNLYSAFVALTLALTKPGGQIVAIIPRSFCNGPYYHPFRKFIFDRAAIRHMHLFESRNKAFKSDNVLQENIIIRLERGAHQGAVNISTSKDDTFSDIKTQEYPFNRIVLPNNPERFIHIPTSADKQFEISPAIHSSLSALKIKVSTGPVVDYRLKEFLCNLPGNDTVPLLYPCHFKDGKTVWPLSEKKKPNAIQLNENTEKWLYPKGFYCVVRRFSSKEEKRRIVASVVDPYELDNSPLLGLENHLNVFHQGKKGLPKELAYGLSSYLNSTFVDQLFRRFSGHTQVNATDLRLLKYPDYETLTKLGKWAMQQEKITQQFLDNKLERMTA